VTTVSKSTLFVLFHKLPQCCCSCLMSAIDSEGVKWHRKLLSPPSVTTFHSSSTCQQWSWVSVAACICGNQLWTCTQEAI